MQAPILALPPKNVMANCEMFVNPEPLNHGLLVNVLFCSLTWQPVASLGFQSPSPFLGTCLDFRGEQVRILWACTLLSLLHGCRQNILFLGGGLRVEIAEVIRCGGSYFSARSIHLVSGDGS